MDENHLNGGIILHDCRTPNLNIEEESISSGVNFENISSHRDPNLNNISNEIFSKQITFSNMAISKERPINRDLEKIQKSEGKTKNSVFESSNIISGREKKPSFFYQMLFESYYSKKEKILYYMNHYVTAHIIVTSLTILKIYAQNSVFTQCTSHEFCKCNDSKAKIISVFLIYIFFLNGIIITVHQFTVYVIFETPKQKSGSLFLYFLFCVIFGFSYLLSKPEIDNMDYDLIYFFIVSVPLVFQLKSLYHFKFRACFWLKHILRINLIPIFIMIHYYFCAVVFGELNHYLKEKFSEDLGRNLSQVYQFFYFRLFYEISVKMFKIYNSYVLSFPHNDVFSTIMMIRLCSVFFVSVPIAGILGMKHLADWGGYLLMISYAVFVFSFYTRIDITFSFLEYIYYKLRPNKKKDKKIEEKNDFLCAQLISGCLFDLIFIINSRLIILIHSRKWFIDPSNPKYYVSCNFEISKEFNMSDEGAYAIIAINIFITLGLVFYMFIKKKRILDYKRPKNFLSNIYVLFMLHGLLEGVVQFVFAVNQD